MKRRCAACLRDLDVAEFSVKSRSSGGLHKECKLCRAGAARAKRTGGSLSSILQNMIQRCHNHKHPKFHLYGGRGITVCEEWRGRRGEAAFLDHIGPRPSNRHSVDRIDNALGYAPGNVRWATQKQQMQNTRRNRLCSVAGVTLPIAEAKRATGISTIRYRLSNGWSERDAVTVPPGKKVRVIEYNGEAMNCHEWSLRLGGEGSLVATRLHNGWTEEEAVSIPVGGRRANTRRAA